MRKYLFSLLNKGHERTVRARKNIIKLLLVRGFGIAVNMALIPISLNLLEEYKFGLWITVFNILAWITLFDIGIGNGLRNKFTAAMSNNDTNAAREYVSTAYVIVTGISCLLILLFIIPWLSVNWVFVFNAKDSLKNELFLLLGITFLMTCIQFILKLINTLLTANHQPAASALVMTISNTLVLSIFLIGNDFLKGNLLGIGFVYTFTPLLILLITSIIFFNGKFRSIRPKFGFFRKEKVHELFSLGFGFFIIQIAVIVIFTTDSLIISHVISPKEVTSYNILLKYFSVITIAVGIIMTPYWSAYTEASSKNDYLWIKATLKKQLKSFFLVFLAILVLTFSAETLVPIWLQYDLDFNISLLVGMASFTLITVWNNIFSFLLNGLSIIKLQIVSSIIGTIVNIPLSIYLAKNLGSAGVILATIVSLSFFAIIGPIEAYKYFKKS